MTLKTCNRRTSKTVETNELHDVIEDWPATVDRWSRHVTAMVRFGLASLVAFGASVGCSEPSGPTAEDLLRRQQKRESDQLSVASTLDEKLGVIHDQLENGDSVSAQKAIRPLLIAHPDDSKVLLMGARCAAANGDVIEAVGMTDSVPESDREMFAAATWMAVEWLIEDEQFDQAERRLVQMLGQDIDLNPVHRKLASILNNQGRRIGAAVHLRALARAGAISEKELFAMNCYSQPFIDSSMPKPKSTQTLKKSLLMTAKLDRIEGRNVQSRNLTERLADAFPESTPISAFLGCLYEEFQDDESLSRWVGATPKGIQAEPEYWRTLGKWLQRQNKHREAVRCLAEAVVLDPTDRVAYASLAGSLKFLNEDQRAETVLKRLELIAETFKIAVLLGKQTGTSSQLNRMADLLDQLQRHWEAVSWREVALKSNPGASEQREALATARDALAVKMEQRTAESVALFHTCGIDRDSWPLPKFDKIGGSSRSIAGAETSEDAPDVPIVLRDVASDVGLEFQYDNGETVSKVSPLLHQFTGGGIGVVDYDLDGFADLYFTQGGGEAFDATGCLPNQMFRNHAGKQFSEVTIPTLSGDQGYGQGVAVADINQDGFPDLLVANIGVNQLLINQGDGTYVTKPLPKSAADGSWTSSIVCGDIDGDHLPEIFEVNYIDDPAAQTVVCIIEGFPCSPRNFQAAPDFVWSVTADMQITPSNVFAGIEEMSSYGFAGVLANFDRKGGNELYVANDGTINHYWVSNLADDEGQSMLQESSRAYGCDTSLMGSLAGSMGVAYGDFDRNGTLDLHVTNFWNQPAELYMQQTSGLFTNANVSGGIAEHSRNTVGWGTHAVDFNRDGWLDFAVLNGHLQDFYDPKQPYKMRPQLFEGNAKGFRLIRPESTDDSYWSTPSLGRTMAVLDWNHDSKPDLVTNHLDVPAALLENQSRSGNSVEIELVGASSERDAIGAVVTVNCDDGQTFTGWVVGGDGMLCSNENVLDFGLGSATQINTIQVDWPSGAKQMFENVPLNRRVLIVEGDAEVFERD